MPGSSQPARTQHLPSEHRVLLCNSYSIRRLRHRLSCGPAKVRQQDSRFPAALSPINRQQRNINARVPLLTATALAHTPRCRSWATRYPTAPVTRQWKTRLQLDLRAGVEGATMEKSVAARSSVPGLANASRTAGIVAKWGHVTRQVVSCRYSFSPGGPFSSPLLCPEGCN